MKTEDYKRGVRDMAAALRKVHAEQYLSLQNINECEERLLADPVPKFKAGMVVQTIRDSYPVKLAYVIERQGDYFYKSNVGTIWEESELRALTPHEATGKE